MACSLQACQTTVRGLTRGGLYGHVRFSTDALTAMRSGQAMQQVSHRFPADVLRTLSETDEVEIEPRQASGKRITIWVVVDGDDVYVRSVRGPQGHWYQYLLADPNGVLHVGQRQIPFRAVLVTDPATIARVSEAYRRKYERKWPTETPDMLTDEVLPTTLRLEPATA